MGKIKASKKKSLSSPLLALALLMTGSAMMVKAFDVAVYMGIYVDYVFIAAIALIIYGVFDLLILPLFEKGDNNHK